MTTKEESCEQKPCKHVDYGWMVLNEGFTQTKFTKAYPTLHRESLNVFEDKSQAEARILNDASERVVRVRVEVVDEG